MDFGDSPDEAGFRSRLRAWLRANNPGLPASSTSDDYWAGAADWHRSLYDAGFFAMSWPKDIGGQELPTVYEVILDEELAAAGAPPRPSLGYLVQGILAHGNDDIRRRFLPGIVNGRDRWCQGFSEPDAGSDLASLRTRAERDGDEWVITGQKVWNTLAHIADRGMLVARTDPDAPKHKGMTYFGLDMHAPGVEVRPLRQMTGEAEFNEVYLTEVRVPDADRIGDVGEGWRVSMTTLMNERTSIGGGGGGVPPRGSGAIAEAVRIWHEEVLDKRPAVRDELMKLWVDAEVLRLTNIRAGQNRRAGNPGPEGSIAKLKFAEVNMAIYELCVDLLGADALVGYDYEMRRAEQLGLTGPPGSSRKMFLRARANSIEGGTSEIQRNIIATSLGL